jgi:hypothetical protein
LKRTALLLNHLLLAAGAAMAQWLACTEVNVIDVIGDAAEPDRTVVVTKGRISIVGETSGIEVPVAAAIDGRNKFRSMAVDCCARLAILSGAGLTRVSPLG